MVLLLRLGKGAKGQEGKGARGLKRITNYELQLSFVT